jgi:putative transposase
LHVEWDWLKNKWAISVEQKRALVEAGPPPLRRRRPWAWLGWARGRWDDQPVGPSAEEIELLRWRDEPYTATPFDGMRRMTAGLRRRGSAVHHTRVGRWLRPRGVEAIAPKPRLSPPAAGHTSYPSLVRGITVNRVNQVGSADLTAVRLAGGWVSLVAVIAWFSRSVLAWALSLTMAVACCVEVLEHALRHGQPERFNTEQGA